MELSSEKDLGKPFFFTGPSVGANLEYVFYVGRLRGGNKGARVLLVSPGQPPLKCKIAGFGLPRGNVRESGSLPVSVA
jgi:hypothetical protein